MEIVIIILLIAIAMVYYFSSKASILRITEDKIQKELEKKLPVSKTYLLIFKVTLDKPRVILSSANEKVNMGLNAILSIKMGKDAQFLSGSIDVSAGIKYVAETGTFFLTDPGIEALNISGIPEKYMQKVNTVINKSLSDYYAEHPIYTLNTGDIKQKTAKLLLKSIVVEDKRIVVRLGR
ncbi:MAG: DUF1439 domain-containing protein [Methylococcales bacterium]|nr:DUF1439 domain-containing protein [Methylococcales bacterium]